MWALVRGLARWIRPGLIGLVPSAALGSLSSIVTAVAMDAAADPLGSIPTVLTSGGLTAGGAFATAFLMLSRGILWTNNAHQEVVQKQEAVSIAEKRGQDALAEELRRQLEQAATREAALLESVANLQGTKDELQRRMSEEVTPQLRLVAGIIKSLPLTEGGTSA